MSVPPGGMDTRRLLTRTRASGVVWNHLVAPHAFEQREPGEYENLPVVRSSARTMYRSIMPKGGCVTMLSTVPGASKKSTISPYPIGDI
jgi:hypothetical protein